jgi:hypothetical protein
LKVIQPFLLEKIESGTYRIITNDLRSCLQMVAKVFPEPCLDNHFILSNKMAINTILESDIDTSVTTPDKIQHLSVFDVSSSNSSVSEVLFTLFYIEGKILLGHYLTRSEKSTQWLEQSSEKFLVHQLLIKVPSLYQAV